MRKLSFRLVLTIGIILLMGISAFGKVIYVNQNAVSSNPPITRDGSSWEKAFLTIGEAITVSKATDTTSDVDNPDFMVSDEIWVAAGTYNERVTLKSGSGLYGGFSGIETQRTLRNWAINRTIIDGSSSGTVITIPSGAPDFTEVSGFYIRNGSAEKGGGIKCDSASAFINDNVIFNCAADYGGGIYLRSGSEVIANNVMYNNEAGSGSAIYACSSAPDIVNNTITGNNSGSSSSIYGEDSNLKIYNNIVSFNAAGIALSSCTASLRNNCVYGNTSFDYNGVTAGIGSLNVDPLFLDVDNGDYHLSTTSPCKEAGFNSSIPPCIDDIDGQPRLAVQYVDIGADEARYVSSAPHTNNPNSNTITLMTLGTVRYVKKHAGGTHDGASWDTAYDTILEGLTAATSGDEVWVAANTYNERITLKNGVALYGGFAGTETSNTQRDGVMNVTTIDGQAGGGVVTAGSTVTSSACIDGFHITNGTGHLSGSYYYGGGIYCTSSSPNITNNVIENNAATYGAGIYIATGNPLIKGNTIKTNAGVIRGGGIYASTTSAIEISLNKLDSNTLSAADALGAGLYLYGSSGTVKNNIVTGNQSSFKGGGIYLYGGTPTVINNCVTGNINVNMGCGIMTYLATASITNNTIAGNTGSTDGGGICCDGQSVATITNNIIAFNAKGIYKSGNSTVTLSKNCVYSNSTSNYYGLSAGQTDINVDPLFADTATSDYHITIDSPCVNTGDDTAVGTGWTDIDFQTRIIGTHVDIGCDEMYPVATPVFSPDEGSYASTQTVTMACDTTGAEIRYTTDGTTPTKTSALYTTPISINTNQTVKAIGLLDLYANSHVKSAVYTIDTIAPTPGTASSPATATSSPIQVTYSGAADNQGGSGLKQVELWFRKDTGTPWINSGVQGATENGVLNFNFENGAGTYYFDLIAEDNAGNRSANPSGDGDCFTVYDAALSASGRTFVHNEYLYPGGPLIRTTAHDESGSKVRDVVYSYGCEGELLSTSGSTESSMYSYDAVYHIKSITDAANHITNYIYDDDGDPNTQDPKQGYLCRVEYPDGEVVKYSDFDTYGRPLTRMDAKSIVTKCHYDDDCGLLTHIEYPATPAMDVYYEYDSEFGRLIRVADGTGVTNYEYDDLDNPTSVTTTYTGLPAKTITYQPWPNGNLMTMTTPAGSFSYTYDAAGRPTGITNPFNELFSWNYHDNDWLQTQTTPVSATTYAFNQRGFLTNLTNRKIDQTLLSEYTGTTTNPKMTYDAVGNILSMTANIPNAATQYSGVTNYSYQDNRSQLSLEQSTRNNGYNHIFEYDTMGNPTVFAGITKSYNSKNQYITGGFAYDANGNPTTYKNHTLTFDPENRMTSFGNILSAGYTGGGLRAWKQSASGRTYFLYSGNSPVCELNNSGDVVAVDTFGPTGLLARREGSSTQGNSKFYTFDPQGNVSLTLNANGSVTSIHLYDAFGKSLYGAAEFPYSFGAQYGYYTDQDTGLQLLGHRYYDSEDGRFVTRDPIGYAGGMNLYSYVQNNPVNMIDPSGYCSIGTKSWWQNLKEGRYFGTTQGESAQGWYAQKSVEHPWNPAYWIGGTLSSLWTPDTYMETVATLSGAYELRGFGVAAKIIQGSGGAGKVYGLVEFGTSKVDYIGQTINVSARETYWRSIYPNHELVVMAENLSKVEADGVEQVFIEGYGGPNGISCGNSNRGTLFNKINKINPKRPYYITATDAAYNILLK